MKKIILALLALALSISLCACGGNTDTDDTENTTTGEKTTETTESTSQTESEEEKVLKARYEAASEALAEYLEDGYFGFYDSKNNWNFYIDNAATEYLYKEFEACGDYEDSAEILSRFTVLPDMLTSITNTTTDNLGNVSEDTYASYEYDEKGTSQDDPILELLGISDYGYDFKYEYDDTDRIISVKLVKWGTVDAIVTPEYDESGNIVKATIQTNDDTYTSTYTYDAQNRLISAEKYVVKWGKVTPYPYSYTYSYDANGNLTEESYSCIHEGTTDKFKTTYSYDAGGNLTEESYSYVYQLHYSYPFVDAHYKNTTYSYDANGYLVMKKETSTTDPNSSYESQTITQFLYTNDENGRPISAELIKTVDGKNSYASQILTYNYETLYFYDAE